MIKLDVLIFGGGIAGLWCLARLRQAGFAAMLIESQRLGGTQTLSSQGIIHSGIKYALTGKITNSLQSIQAMPQIWRACLTNTGELDLSQVTILSQHQYLWSTAALGSTLAGFFASHALRSRVVALHDIEMYPSVLQHPQFKGQVYQLDEPILDTASLVTTLAHHGGDACLWLNSQMELRINSESTLTLELLAGDGKKLCLQPRRVVLAAGAGNAQLLAQFDKSKPAMQLRPLHMLMARGPLPPLYAHCLGLGSNPRLTITSHPLSNGESVWYLGGQLAEAGVKLTSLEQIAAGQRELAALLPWLDLKPLQWASWRVDRAEPRQPGGMRPQNYFFATHDNISTAWPTKLALAPALTAELFSSLAQAGIQPHGQVAPVDWPQPPAPQLPWELAF